MFLKVVTIDHAVVRHAVQFGLYAFYHGRNTCFKPETLFVKKLRRTNRIPSANTMPMAIKSLGK
jgi:hypothetical protein